MIFTRKSFTCSVFYIYIYIYIKNYELGKSIYLQMVFTRKSFTCSVFYTFLFYFILFDYLLSTY